MAEFEYNKNSKLVFEPRCEIAKMIRFIDGKCPYSFCDSCDACIKDDLDKYYIDILKDEKRCWKV